MLSLSSIATRNPMHRRAASLRHLLLDWRTSFGFGRLESVVLATYLFLVALTIRHHEPWSDEAQAWIIARDNSLWQILRYRLHYEGSPGLWHVILHVFHRLGGRYGGIDWLGAAFAACGIVVLLRYSPLPLIVRLLLPFTFFLQYQYAVIARGYTLFPLLTFILCALYHNRRANPLWFALCAGLLANITLQGAVFSFFIVGIYLYDRFAEARSTALSRILTPAGLFLALLGASAIVAMPAPDCGIAHGPPVTSGFLHDVTMHFPGPLPESEYPPEPPPITQVQALHFPKYPVFPLDPPHPRPRFLSSPARWAVWYINHDEFDSSGRIQPRSFLQPTFEFLIDELTLATAPLASLKILSCTFLIVLFLWLRRRGKVRMLLPWIANIFVGEVLWIADHHSGLLWISLIAAAWIASDGPSKSGKESRLDLAFVLLLSLVCAGQVAWAFASIRNDIFKPYDPSSQTAAFLLQHQHQRMAAFDFEAVGVQPYFAQNPFFNFRHAYWVWNTGENPDADHFTTLEQHPDIVLFSEDLLASGFMRNDWAPLSPLTADSEQRDLARNPIILDLYAHAYRETHRFCGLRFMRFNADYETCHLIFERSPTPADAH